MARLIFEISMELELNFSISIFMFGIITYRISIIPQTYSMKLNNN